MDLLERAFDHPEGWLGRLGGWVMAHRNRQTSAWVVNLLDLAPDHRVLEIGFGPGVGIEQVLKRHHTIEVAGVDPSPEMIEAARDRNQAAIDERRVDLRGGAVEELPWPSASFDRIFTVDTYQAWRDPTAALAEIKRVLSYDGRLAIGFTPRTADQADGLPDDLVRAGFYRPRRRRSKNGVCVVAEA